jgi:hypothetical protein
MELSGLRQIVYNLMEEKKELFLYNREKLDFEIRLYEGFSDMNLYYIVGKVDHKSDLFIKCLSDPKIRQELSNNKMKCEKLSQINENQWYEKITYNTESDRYSIEKFQLLNNCIIGYSEHPPNYQTKKDYNEKENFFSMVKVNKDSKLEILLTFDEFDTIQDFMVDSFLSYLRTLETAIKK